MVVYQKYPFHVFLITDWREKGGRESHFNLGIPQSYCSSTSGKQSMTEGLVRNKTNWHSVALKLVLYTEATFTFTKAGCAARNAKLTSRNLYLEHYQTYIKAHSHIRNITTYCIYGAQRT